MVFLGEPLKQREQQKEGGQWAEQSEQGERMVGNGVREGVVVCVSGLPGLR